MANRTSEAQSRLHDELVSDATLQTLLGYHLKRASHVVQADLQRALKPFDLRTLTYTALVLVVDNPGLSQTQLADAMGLERPNLVPVVDNLEAGSLIKRERDKSDRRTNVLTATDKGRDICEQATKAVRAHEAAIFGSLDKATRQTIIAVLTAVRGTEVRG